MRIVPFPGHDGVSIEQAWLSELDAALNGTADGPEAVSWRELREDVRVLAPPMSADFERQLAQRIAERGVRRQARRGTRGAGRARELRSRMRKPRLRRPGRPALAAIAAAASAVGVAILVVVGPSSGGRPPEAVPHSAVEPGVSAPGRVSGEGAGAAGGSGSGSGAGSSAGPDIKAPAETSRGAKAAAAEAAEASPGGPASSAAPAPAPGHVQQLAASVTLAVSSGAVQSSADRVARLAVGDGGYVQSSRVQVQQAGTSEADLVLKLPSEKVGVALASLERVATVREESQSLEDITGSYDAARRRLADATAERTALLRALSHAITQGQIESLHERLAQSSSAITHARSAFEAVSRRAGTAEVEVTVVGDAHASSEGLTLHRGLHDAGRVLVATLTVLLIAAAVLVPSSLLLVALVAARRAWRRQRRERALDAG
jgi:hypothetical protein